MGNKVIYPQTLTEAETLEAALAGRSIARFGDGEFRLAVGGRAISQEANPKLADELRFMLARRTHALVCIPRIDGALPKDKVNGWMRYTEPRFVKLLDPRRTYGSAFITRPDSAPSIDNEKYWNRFRDCWRERDCTLVIGSQRSITTDMMAEAKSIRVVDGTYHDSYAEIDRIEQEVGEPAPPARVILCLGATATVLAERLARKGVHALDLGHAGMFIRRRERGQAA